MQVINSEQATGISTRKYVPCSQFNVILHCQITDCFSISMRYFWSEGTRTRNKKHIIKKIITSLLIISSKWAAASATDLSASENAVHGIHETRYFVVLFHEEKNVFSDISSK